LKSPIASIALLAKQPLGMERDIELDAKVNDVAGLLTVLEQSSQNWPASLGNSFSLKADAHVTDSAVEDKSVEFNFAKNSMREAMRVGFLTGSIFLAPSIWVHFHGLRAGKRQMKTLQAQILQMPLPAVGQPTPFPFQTLIS
jgi:hypothetical protein